MSLGKVLITGSSSGLGNHLAVYYSRKAMKYYFMGEMKKNLFKSKKSMKMAKG